MSKVDFSFENVTLNEAPAEAGVYPVEIVECDGYVTQSGNKRVSFRARVDGGAADGCTIKDGINLPTKDSQNVKKVWLGFFKSLGMSPAEVADVFGNLAGKDGDAEFYAKEIGKQVMGLKGYMYYEPAVEQGTWPKRQWLTPQQAKARANVHAAGLKHDTSVLDDFTNI